MKNIRYFNATPRSSRIIRSHQKTWVLPQTCHLNYSDNQTLTILSQEKVRLPFKHSSIKPTNLQLLEINQTSGTYIRNQITKAKLVVNERNKHGVNYVEVSGLSEGQYVLWLKKENVRMFI